MPKESLNVYMTAIDKMSPVLATIGDKTKALDKETQMLQQSYEALQRANEGLIERKTALQKQLKKVNDEVAEARKNFKELGDEASENAYKKALKNQEKLRTSLAETNKALRENQSIYQKNMETIRKSAIGSSSRTTLSSLAKGLVTSQVGEMLADSVGGYLTSELTSAIGAPEASLISNTLSSAISGAAAGAILGPTGSLIGGLVGGASGALSGYTEIKEAKDDAFKEYYTGLYDDVNASTEDMISSGSTIAGSREQTRMAFVKRLGSEEEADAYYNMVAAILMGIDGVVDFTELTVNGGTENITMASTSVPILGEVVLDA